MAEHNRRRPLIPLLILLVLALAAGGYFWWRSARATEPTGVSASGAVEAQQYQVASVIAGRVTKVAVSEGDVVKQGQTLVVGSVSAEAASRSSGAGREGCQGGTQQRQEGRHESRRLSSPSSTQSSQGRSRSGKGAARVCDRSRPTVALWSPSRLMRAKTPVPAKPCSH